MHSAGWLAFAAGGYLIGSIPFGVIIGRLHGVDVRQHGSRNIGATNVGRVLGRRWGLVCFALDSAKGAVPVLLAGVLGGTIGRGPGEVDATTLGWWLLVAAAALVGHMFSPFIGFRGGKGVATGFGALLAYWPLLGASALIALFTWIMVLAISRFVSLASIVAALSLPVSVLALWGSSAELRPIVAASAALALLVVVRHRTNIARLLRGEEPRIGANLSGTSPPGQPPLRQNDADVRA